MLDLDGTLVTTYSPRRAPRLPPGCTSFLCGQGSKLNPQGVLVIERPGLRQFLQRLASFAGVCPEGPMLATCSDLTALCLVR